MHLILILMSLSSLGFSSTAIESLFQKLGDPLPPPPHLIERIQKIMEKKTRPLIADEVRIEDLVSTLVVAGRAPEDKRTVTLAADGSGRILGWNPRSLMSFELGSRRYFMGYTPANHQLQILAEGDQKKFEFALVEHYGESGKKLVFNLSPPQCVACHHDAQPIFSKAPWHETIADSDIFAGLTREKGHLDPIARKLLELNAKSRFDRGVIPFDLVVRQFTDARRDRAICENICDTDLECRRALINAVMLKKQKQLNQELTAEQEHNLNTQLKTLIDSLRRIYSKPRTFGELVETSARKETNLSLRMYVPAQPLNDRKPIAQENGRFYLRQTQEIASANYSPVARRSVDLALLTLPNFYQSLTEPASPLRNLSCFSNWTEIDWKKNSAIPTEKLSEISAPTLKLSTVKCDPTKKREALAFFKHYCTACHSDLEEKSGKKSAMADLEDFIPRFSYASLEGFKSYRSGKIMSRKLQLQEMPPTDYLELLSASERDRFRATLSDSVACLEP